MSSWWENTSVSVGVTHNQCRSCYSSKVVKIHNFIKWRFLVGQFILVSFLRARFFLFWKKFRKSCQPLGIRNNFESSYPIFLMRIFPYFHYPFYRFVFFGTKFILLLNLTIYAQYTNHFWLKVNIKLMKSSIKCFYNKQNIFKIYYHLKLEKRKTLNPIGWLNQKLCGERDSLQNHHISYHWTRFTQNQNWQMSNTLDCKASKWWKVERGIVIPKSFQRILYTQTNFIKSILLYMKEVFHIFYLSLSTLKPKQT